MNKVGDRVFITDQKHPWIGCAGTVIATNETYGLGWTGDRVRLDENRGETYVKPDQVMGPGKVTSMSFTMRRKKGAR